MNRKILAILMAVCLLAVLGVPALAASGEASSARVITGVTLAAEAADLVDSAQYSQYETVAFSDGTSHSIDPATQTFVLVRDGTVVDLGDSANWTADAELYIVEKNMSDTVAMSMNKANFGDFWFTSVLDFEDGEYVLARSVPAAFHGGEVSDAGVKGGTINIDASYISGIYVYNEDGSRVTVEDVTINSSGLGGNDFGTNGAWGAVISAAGSSEMDISGVTVNTEGPLHDGIWAGGSSVVDVHDSVVFAVENADKWGFEPYSYDRFIITSEPLSEEEIAARGLSGQFFTEESSGTSYYYYNDNYTSNWSAPMLQCVPLALGLYGSMRATCCYGSATLSFYDSLVVSDVWAVLSTDSGKGTLNATDTVGVVGVQVETEEDADMTVTVDGKDYYVDAYGTADGCGYVTYCDGFDDNFFGCRFYAPDYLAILTGGTFDFTSSDTQRGYGWSDRIGFMSHGQAYTAVLSHSDFDVGDALYSVMSTGGVDITLDDVTVQYHNDNAWGGVLFQFMDTDDVGTDANDMEMDVVDLTYEEYLSNTAASEGSTKTLTIKNSVLTGDIYNSTGSSNNASTLSKYDGSTGLLSSWSTSTVAVTLDNTQLDGVISTSYAQHCDENGEPIVGQFFFNKTGEPMDGTADNTYNYLAARRVINTPAYNGIGKIDLTLTGGAVWNVTGEGILNSLTIDSGSTVNGVVTVDGVVVDTTAGGSWSGDIHVAPAVEVVDFDGEAYIALADLENLLG